MTLNKTKIEWCTRTWNPVTGCLHGCSYCYARKIAERFKGSKAWPNGFEPTFHPERLGDLQKETKPQTIFVCSMADLFGQWVPFGWIDEIFTMCLQYPRHTYCFLTKNPFKMKEAIDRYSNSGALTTWKEFASQMWFGVSVVGYENPETQTTRIEALKQICGVQRFISFEPLLSDPGELDLTGIKQVIIGAQTNPFIPPPGDGIRHIVRAANESGTKIFFKDTLNGVEWVGMSTYVNTRELCWDLNIGSHGVKSIELNITLTQ